jgi:hypothetical protein
LSKDCAEGLLRRRCAIRLRYRYISMMLVC